jgi:hypothetical protein
LIFIGRYILSSLTTNTNFGNETATLERGMILSYNSWLVLLFLWQVDSLDCVKIKNIFIIHATSFLEGFETWYVGGLKFLIS